MDKPTRLLMVASTAVTLFVASCGRPVNNNLVGNWHSKDGSVKLQITDKKFITNDGETITEDYFVTGDTLYTSFQGNQPYTMFIIQNLDAHNLKLMGPDSVAVEYSR